MSTSRHRQARLSYLVLANALVWLSSALAEAEPANFSEPAVAPRLLQPKVNFYIRRIFISWNDIYLVLFLLMAKLTYDLHRLYREEQRRDQQREFILQRKISFKEGILKFLRQRPVEAQPVMMNTRQANFSERKKKSSNQQIAISKTPRRISESSTDSESSRSNSLATVMQRLDIFLRRKPPVAMQATQDTDAVAVISARNRVFLNTAKGWLADIRLYNSMLPKPAERKSAVKHLREIFQTIRNQYSLEKHREFMKHYSSSGNNFNLLLTLLSIRNFMARNTEISDRDIIAKAREPLKDLPREPAKPGKKSGVVSAPAKPLNLLKKNTRVGLGEEKVSLADARESMLDSWKNPAIPPETTAAFFFQSGLMSDDMEQHEKNGSNDKENGDYPLEDAIVKFVLG